MGKYELKPCPKCGKRLLSYGKAYYCYTPKYLRILRSIFRHGVTCCNCGYYRPTVMAWNRRADDG